VVVVHRPPSGIVHPTLDPDPQFYILEEEKEIFRIFTPGRYNTKALTFRDFGPLHRFDHHRPAHNSQPKIDSQRGIYYAALTLRTCLIEIFGDTGAIAIDKQKVARPIVTSPIKLLDLRGFRAIKAGSVAAVSMIRERNLTQEWSRYFYKRTNIYSLIDGLIYSSAHNGEEAIALYERAKNKLECPENNIIDLNNRKLRSHIQKVARDHNMIVDYGSYSLKKEEASNFRL